MAFALNAFMLQKIKKWLGFLIDTREMKMLQVTLISYSTVPNGKETV